MSEGVPMTAIPPSEQTAELTMKIGEHCAIFTTAGVVTWNADARRLLLEAISALAAQAHALAVAVKRAEAAEAQATALRTERDEAVRQCELFSAASSAGAAERTALREALAETVERFKCLLSRGDLADEDAAVTARRVKVWDAALHASPAPKGGESGT